MVTKRYFITASVTPDAGDTYLLYPLIEVESELNALVDDDQIARMSKLYGKVRVQASPPSQNGLYSAYLVLIAYSDSITTTHTDTGESGTFNPALAVNTALTDEKQTKWLANSILEALWGDADANPSILQAKLSFSYKPSKKAKAQGFFRSNEHLDAPELVFVPALLVVGEVGTVPLVVEATLSMEYDIIQESFNHILG